MNDAQAVLDRFSADGGGFSGLLGTDGGCDLLPQSGRPGGLSACRDPRDPGLEPHELPAGAGGDGGGCGKARPARRPDARLLPVAGSMGVFRIYDLDGTELARSPLTSGYFSLPGTGVYDYFLHFDPVLTDDEQLALARLLRADKDLCAFYGAEGGLYGEGDVDRPGLYGEVTGVVEHNVVYPQKLVYYFADGPLTLLDTDSAYFEGKTLTTLAFDAARLQSPSSGAMIRRSWLCNSSGRLRPVWTVWWAAAGRPPAGSAPWKAAQATPTAV
ncbi:MAG: hypothetical protein ACLSAF_08840 [Intestinimonas sp.]